MLVFFVSLSRFIRKVLPMQLGLDLAVVAATRNVCLLLPPSTLCRFAIPSSCLDDLTNEWIRERVIVVWSVRKMSCKDNRTILLYTKVITFQLGSYCMHVGHV